MAVDNKSAYDSSAYDGKIVNVLPYYREYGAQIIDFVKATGKTDIDWLETGCGTGTLASLILESRNDVKLTLLDPSQNMLDIAESRLAGKNVQFRNIGSEKIDYDSEYDVITAVQCHHYFQPDERKVAVENCYRALREGGVFIAYENIRMSTDDSDRITLDRWVNFLAEHGNSEDGIKLQLDRRGVETHPITVEEHLSLLKEVGFKSVDILWASYLQAGFVAIK